MGDAAFGAAALAEVMGVSPRHLRRRVVALAGKAPSALIRRVRLEQATLLLSVRQQNVKEAAAATGFRSLSGFRAAFLDVYGVSPSTFARQPGAPLYP
jgi:AraC-like DNA-binding protein